jgi:6-phosphofructokinase 1
MRDETINIDQIAADIRRGMERGKESSIIIAAEGEKEGISHQIKQELREQHGIESRVCILGHIQRGGSPTAYDRFRASQMGYFAVNALIAGEKATVAVARQGEVLSVPLSQCLGKKCVVDPTLLDMVRTLSV